MNQEKHVRAAIVGSTGYGGVELIRLLLNHPNVTITSVISASSAGAPIAEGYPHLNEVMCDTLDGVDVEEMRRKADVVFTATPFGCERTAGAEAAGGRTRRH
ncbi:N-acetyl-gamma-glutamyl-phosphate reductase 2 [Paenibacillus alvei DSM 29]|nr:N-acetyl-gamma-glutamyl-phosphate reductase 2 [Paenibacillus alvei DSM 29]